jgi:DNA-binding CsgD family transcriptional regulator
VQSWPTPIGMAKERLDGRPPAADLGRSVGLSPRQVEIIVRVANGMLDKQVARDLGIAVTTVRTQIGRIGRKTGCTRRAELTALAYELGLI